MFAFNLEELQLTITNATDTNTAVGLTTSTQTLLILLTALITLLGFTGNLFILIGSIRYNAVDLDKISVLFIQHIAVSDLWISVEAFFPLVITLTARGWMLGPLLCYLDIFSRYHPVHSQILFIISTSAYKLSRLLNPLSLPLSNTKGRLIVALCWVLPVVFDLLLISESYQEQFEPKLLQCVAYAGSIVCYFYASFRLSSLVTMLVINSAILVIARRRMSANNTVKRGNKHGNKALVTISLVCWVFILAYIPTGISCLMSLFDYNVSSDYGSFSSYFLNHKTYIDLI